MSKQVSFSPDCKKYDGPTTRYSSLYAYFFIGFFNGNLKTRADVLRHCEDNREFIDFCIREALIAKSKFDNLKQRDREYQKEYKRKIIMEDEDSWIGCRPGIPIIRFGCSSRIANFKLYPEHFSKICNFILLLQEADDYLFECSKLI